VGFESPCFRLTAEEGRYIPILTPIQDTRISAEDGDRWREVKTTKLLENLQFPIDGERWRTNKNGHPFRQLPGISLSFPRLI
jgi:hypothetical protein